ncbi:Phosphoribosylformylglycinamidine synthetase, PurS subunit [Candidatus Magnetoovum chiemensis]|nr:Phosphoribosylformylglycinamidine synthetase, PurS subunit [Candidatus Magnetoovum chiemensis]
MKVTVKIKLKDVVLDPQGKAVLNGIHKLGFDFIKDVRVGKLIELDIDNMEINDGEAKVKELCEKLLANTIIEDYAVDVR